MHFLLVVDAASEVYYQLEWVYSRRRRWSTACRRSTEGGAARMTRVDGARSGRATRDLNERYDALHGRAVSAASSADRRSSYSLRYRQSPSRHHLQHRRAVLRGTGLETTSGWCTADRTV